MKRTFAACAAAILLAVSGCGAGGGSGNPDPATLAPPGALAYATFQIAPKGEEKPAFDAAFGKLLGPAPEAKLGAAFTAFASTNGRLDYFSDVKPWLGDTLSVVVTRVAPRRSDFALLAASTDDDRARAAIDKDLAGVHTETRSYRDVSYKVLDDGTVNGVVSHFLVAGTESAFKSVVDAAEDGKSLADSEQFKTSVGERDAGKVGLAYVDAKGLLQSYVSNLPGAERLVGPLLLGLVQLHPFVATLDAQPDALVVDVSSPGTKPDPRGSAAASSPLIESMPADAWLALALPDVGEALSKIAAVLKANPLIAPQYEGFAATLRQRTGLELDKDVLTLGDVGVFATGTTPAKAGLTVVAQSAKDATLRRLRALVPAQAQGRVRVQGSIGSGARLGDEALFKKAAGAIGQRPTLFVDFGPALDLAAASPRHRSDAHFQRALPHLRHIEFVAVGARRDRGLDVVRAVVGLR